jgi:hypothetical protein
MFRIILGLMLLAMPAAARDYGQWGRPPIISASGFSRPTALRIRPLRRYHYKRKGGHPRRNPHPSA